ncbi:MAG: N-acetyltransferase family protein [Terracidiphilus sp.]
MLRDVHPYDAFSISEIYNHYVQHTPITFEETPIAPDDMRSRILKITSALPWIVCEEDGKLIGYAYASKWRERSAYRHSVEATVYLHPTAVGKGKGSELLGSLLTALRAREIHCVMGGVALPNPASIALLEKFRPRQVAHFREVGYKFGQWIDVGYWQLVF